MLNQNDAVFLLHAKTFSYNQMQSLFVPY